MKKHGIKRINLLVSLLAVLLLASCASTQPLPAGIISASKITVALTTVDVTVNWTCVGAHGNVGIAGEHDLRIIKMTDNDGILITDSVAVHNLFEFGWLGQPWVPNVPNPLEAGTAMSFTFSSYLPFSTALLPGHTYAISMKARNSDDQWGALGNIHIFTTPEPTGPPGTIDDVRITVQIIVEVVAP